MSTIKNAPPSLSIGNAGNGTFPTDMTVFDIIGTDQNEIERSIENMPEQGMPTELTIDFVDEYGDPLADTVEKMNINKMGVESYQRIFGNKKHALEEIATYDIPHAAGNVALLTLVSSIAMLKGKAMLDGQEVIELTQDKCHLTVTPLTAVMLLNDSLYNDHMLTDSLWSVAGIHGGFINGLIDFLREFNDGDDSKLNHTRLTNKLTDLYSGLRQVSVILANTFFKGVASLDLAPMIDSMDDAVQSDVVVREKLNALNTGLRGMNKEFDDVIFSLQAKLIRVDNYATDFSYGGKSERNPVVTEYVKSESLSTLRGLINDARIRNAELGDGNGLGELISDLTCTYLEANSLIVKYADIECELQRAVKIVNKARECLHSR